MQLDGRQQRSSEGFVMEETSWDVGVRVGGTAMEREGFLPSIPGEGEGMGAMWGGAFGGDEMPLVDSAGGAGWVEGQLGVASFAAEVQNGRGGMEGGEQGDGRGPRFFLLGLCHRSPGRGHSLPTMPKLKRTQLRRLCE